MREIIIHCLVSLLFLISCGKSRDMDKGEDMPKNIVKIKSDSLVVSTNTNYYRILYIKPPQSEDHSSFQIFPLVKKKLRIPITEDFANDYEIRLYVIPTFHGIHCYRYFLKDGSWRGQRMMFTVEQDKKNVPVYELVNKWDIHPKISWVAFIQELLKENLLNMPTNAELQQEIAKLQELYPNRAIGVIDGRTCYIEIVSKGYYDYRHYENTIAVADDYPQAIVMRKINALISTLQSVEDGKTMTTSKYPIK